MTVIKLQKSLCLNIISISNSQISNLIQYNSDETGNAEELSQIGENSWNFQARRCNCYVSTRYTNIDLAKGENKSKLA